MSYVYLATNSLTHEDSLTIRDAIVQIAISQLTDWLENIDNKKSCSQLRETTDTLLGFAEDIDKKMAEKSIKTQAD